jgi:hypothetical protein
MPGLFVARLTPGATAQSSPAGPTLEKALMLIIALLVRTAAGIAGGHLATMLLPGAGRLTKIIAGGIGGLIGGAIVGAAAGAVDSETVNTVSGWLAGILGGGAGGALLTIIAGQIIKAIRG